jgi:hypothetical protein
MPSSEWDAKAVSRRAHAAWSDSVHFAQHLAGRAAPFVSHAAVSAAAFTAALATAQARTHTRTHAPPRAAATH